MTASQKYFSNGRADSPRIVLTLPNQTLLSMKADVVLGTPLLLNVRVKLSLTTHIMDLMDRQYFLRLEQH
jgi:hypothetical protein